MSFLLEKLQAGDLETFREIFYQYNDKLYGFILAKTQSSDFSEEVTHLTFIKLWKSRKNLTSGVKLSTQIFQIAKTVMIDELRKLERIKKNKEKWLADSACLQPSSEDGYNTVSSKELQKKFQDIISNMPPVRQRVYQLSREEQLTHKEISERLSISTKTVEKHMQLALRNIRPFIKSFFSIFF